MFDSDKSMPSPSTKSRCDGEVLQKIPRYQSLFIYGVDLNATLFDIARAKSRASCRSSKTEHSGSTSPRMARTQRREDPPDTEGCSVSDVRRGAV